MLKNKAQTILFSLAALLTSALFLGSCSDSDSHSDNRFIVYVVGDGVPPIRRDINRLFPLNRAQGQAMWRGAKTAFDLSPRLEPIRHLIKLKGFDDASLNVEAQNFARSLKEQSAVIAVIGHATSQTTRAAIGYYAAAGIPVLMPIATSDLVMYPEEEPSVRVNNAFRLPPSDARAQAPAVAYLVREQELRKVLLVQDISEGALGYSSTLVTALAPLIRASIVAIVRVDLASKETLTEAADKALSNDVQGVVFCGYGSTAKELFYALKVRYHDDTPEQRPTMILTDGCLVEDLNPEGFNSFLTFPHLGIEDTGRADQEKDFTIVRSLYNRHSPLSYEPFGYDAMLVLGQAIQACLNKGKLSRNCVTKELNNPPQPFFGVAGIYEFELGENRNSRYDIFRSGLDTGYKFDTRNKIIVSAEELSRIRSGQ